MKSITIGLAATVLLSTQVSYSASAPGTSLHQFPVQFKSEAAKPIKLSEWAGKNLVVTMAYTSCGSTCPMTMQKLRDMQKRVDELGQSAEFIVVTLDSKKDTPEMLADYRKKANLMRPNWHFLTGSETDIRKLSMVLGIKYKRNPDTGEIMHDNKIVLVNPKGEVIRTLPGLNAPIEPLFSEK